jgi:site-specific DNA recombinase
MARAVLYARVSSREQVENGYSLRQQLEALRQYAASNGYEVIEEVTDPGVDGGSLDRPGLIRVRDLVAAGDVSVVLAQDRDRFARDPILTAWLRRQFEDFGTQLRSLQDRGDDSPEGELTDGILDQIARYEKKLIARRTVRGREQRAREDHSGGFAALRFLLQRRPNQLRTRRSGHGRRQKDLPHGWDRRLFPIGSKEDL